MSSVVTPVAGEKKMRFAFLWMRLADEPFVVLVAILSFLMKKDLGASALQISMLVTIRPVVSLFSFYWGANLMRKRTRLLPNLMSAWAFGRLPFLLVPVVQNVWYLIICVAIYQFFYRAGTPALMEMLKLTMSREKRDKLFSLAVVFSFIEGAVFGVVLGWLFGMDPFIWKILFALAALLSVSSLFFQKRVELPPVEDNPKPRENRHLIQPWIDSIKLLKARPDFAYFQVGFMLGGVGLMLMSAPVVIFCHDVLNVSRTEFTHARTIWMGVGVVLSTFAWKKALSAMTTNKMTSLVLMVFAIYPFTILLSANTPILLFVAFLIYGIGQSGSQLLWNLSGTYFAGEDESSKYTTVNVLTVGLRGLVAPLAGGLLCDVYGSMPIIFSGMVICFIGACFMMVVRKAHATPTPA